MRFIGEMLIVALLVEHDSKISCKVGKKTYGVVFVEL